MAVAEYDLVREVPHYRTGSCRVDEKRKLLAVQGQHPAVAYFCTLFVVSCFNVYCGLCAIVLRRKRKHKGGVLFCLQKLKNKSVLR